MIRTPFDTPPEEGAAIEVAPGILWMRLPLPMRLDHVNVFALDDGDGWTVIDTGFDSRRGRAIWEGLLAGPLGGQPVTRVIGTHHHPDHIGLAGWLMATQGASLAMTRTAWLMARMLVLDDQPRPPAESLDFWRRAGMPADLLAKRAAERPFNFADVVHPLPLGFDRLSEGQVIRMGGRDWRIAMGHGHAPCHATFWSQDDGLVIGGDQLLPSISPNLGVYPTEPGADPVGEWLDSCERLLPLSRDDQLVLPGHKLPFVGLPFRLRQLIENHRAALDRLAAALAETPRSAVDCFDILFRRRIGEGEFGLALVEAVAHLNRLGRDGRARPVGERDGAVLWGA
ncbi:MBL fold metallo-hydrolase [Paracoccus sp. PARArs4]|uniref:MBL fold metallo-hydrolase n=1 Tax=Paracoccus sp. PARArs4 TaxID=2853442 RepID=UPI0024A6CADE|nr:MBL fold metallo-hydrolase [Paracoccus sp. PARArs4]